MIIIECFCLTDVKEPTPTPTPSTPPDKISLNFIADVIFIMDSSSSVSSRDYSKEKEFVKYLATYLNVLPGNSRAALITYGNAASEVIEFDIKRLRADFESAVEKAPFVGRNRRIDRALEKASQMMANARPWVRKIVILLTSGKQSRESGSKTPGEAAIPLLDKGVYNYVVAIGQEPDISELRPVVQQPAQIFRMTSFDDLEPRKTTVGGIIVETSSKFYKFRGNFSHNLLIYTPVTLHFVSQVQLKVCKNSKTSLFASFL